MHFARLKRTIAIVHLLLACASPALAKVQLSIDVGWNNRFRVGRWTPIYVTLQDSAPRQVLLEIYAPTDRRYAMKTIESVAIGPQPVTVAMYVPLSYQINESSVSVRDAGSGRLLENLVLSDNSAYPGQPSMGGPEVIDTGNVFIGVSGNASTERLLSAQLNYDRGKTGFVTPVRLPAVAIGYDNLDLLLLNEPDLSRINIDQQRAIADWVRAGGTLLVLAGADPFPATGPISEILPALVGPNKIFEFDTNAISTAGLPSRFAKPKGRQLTPSEDAKPIHLFGASEPVGYRRWAGFGQVAVIGIDVSTFVFNTPEQAQAFWRSTLAGLVTLPIVENTNSPNYYWNQNSRRSIPMRQTLDWIGDVPGAGEFGFGYLASVLLALMIVVGPVDWFVLKWTGKQPWTWITTCGWIGLVTLGAILIGHVFKSGDLYFRTASIIDEAAGVRVAAKDLLGIYSPQTQEYDIKTDPEGWWQPPSDDMSYYGSGNMQLEIPCHQDYRGSRPLPLLINVWNMRLLEGTQYGSAAAMIEATLKLSGKTVSGKIVNHAPSAISNVQVRTSAGVAKIKDPIPAGATIDISATLDAGDITLATQPVDQQQIQMQRYSVRSVSTSQPTQATLSSLVDERATRIDQILRERSDIAVVYGSFDGSPDPRAGLGIPEAKQSHLGLVRALVPLE